MGNRAGAWGLKRLVVAAMLAGVALLAAGLAAADGPQTDSPWPQFKRDGAKTARSTVNGPTQPVQAWTNDAGSPIIAGPVIAKDGTIYVVTDSGRVRAVSPTGQTKWDYATPGATYPMVNKAGVIMVGRTDGFIVGLNANDGSEAWKLDLGNTQYGTSGLASRGPASGAENYGRNLIGTDKGIVFELDDAGVLVGVRRATDGYAVYTGEPVSPDGTVIWASYDKAVYGGFASGGDKWRFPVDDLVNSTPAVGADNTTYVGTNAGSLYAIKTDGTQKWHVKLGGPGKSSPALAADGTIYVGSDDGNLYAIDPATGATTWTFKTAGAINSAPAVGANGLIYVGSFDNNLYVLTPDGKQQSVFKTGNQIDRSSPAIGADGTLYIGSRDGRLYALKEGATATFVPGAAATATATPGPSATPTTPPAPPTATPTPLPTDRANPIPDAQYFSETGHNVRGGFLNYFNTRGGLEQFGYPRTDEFAEDGKTVQYFQRARFEFFPQFAGTPYEVQLGLLGDVVTASQRPFPTVAPTSGADLRYFPEVSHTTKGVFLRYFDANGGLDRFGFPISEELQEQNNDGTGRTYTVQYFQRARLEFHPELAGTPFEVELGLLGDQVLRERGWLKG